MKITYLALALTAAFAVHCGGEAPAPQDPSTTSTPPAAPSVDADAGVTPSAEPAKK